MTTKTRILSVLATSTTLTLACGVLAPSAHAQSKETIKIGVPTALSGPYGVLAAEVKRSVDFAAEQANAKGGIDGRKVEVRYVDSEAKPDVARKQAEKLALDGFNILTGTISSGEGLAMGPMLDRWDAIYVSTFSKSTKLTGDSCQSRLFRVNQSDPFDIAVVKPWIGARKEKKWMSLGADNAWGRDAGKSFREMATANGKEVVADVYSALGTSDYAPFIQQMKAAAPDGIFVALSGRDAINFVNQAKQFGLLDNVVVAGISLNLDSVIKAVGPAIKGVWGNMNYSATIDTPQNKEFVAAWRKMYNGDEPTDLEGENYVGMQVILQAIEQAKSSKPADVAKVLSGGTFDTVFGKATIRAEDHQMVLPNYFGQVAEKDGKLRNVVSLTMSPSEATPPVDPACKMPKL